MIEYATYCNKYSINTPKIIFPIHIITSQALYQTEENCFEAVWDTGATNTCISPHLANVMKLISCDKAPIEGIYGYSNALLFKTNILLPNNIIFKNHLVYGTKLGSIDMLIGMDIISKCDSTILNAENNIEFSFKIPIVENNEYELYDNSDQEN